MSILKRSKVFFTFILICTSLQLAGCKVTAEVGEALFHFLGKIAVNLIENSVFNNDAKPTNTIQNNTDTLPFILLEGETYQKINNNQDQLDYYAVQRLNGSTEHYSIDGELLWSSIESDLDNEQPPDEYAGLIFSESETSEEIMQIRTEVQQ